jgi:hypothetical protein
MLLSLSTLEFLLPKLTFEVGTEIMVAAADWRAKSKKGRMPLCLIEDKELIQEIEIALGVNDYATSY